MNLRSLKIRSYAHHRASGKAYSICIISLSGMDASVVWCINKWQIKMFRPTMPQYVECFIHPFSISFIHPLIHRKAETRRQREKYSNEDGALVFLTHVVLLSPLIT